MSSSEINQVLGNSLSPDANLRQAAEQQLTQAAETNFPLYLATLVQELANENTQGSIRAAAGLALKNAFTARDFARHQDLQTKWLQGTDEETKTQVKNLTLQTLASSNAQAGQAAAQVISSIAAIELPRNQWQDLLNILVKNTQVKNLTLQTLASSNAQAGQAAAQVISSIAAIELPRNQWQDLLNILGDRIMGALLQILNSVGAKSSVPDSAFAAISALANAMEEDFNKYMEAFTPFLYNALANQEEPSLCSMAIGLVSDLTRSLGERSQPYCDNFMNHLLNNLKSTTLSNQFKPAILQCFGDIAGAIGGHFETYLAVIAQVLQQAATVNATADGPYEMYDYVVSLREGIMDAWGGIIGAMKSSGKTAVLQEQVPHIFQLLSQIASDMNRSEALMRASMGVIGDLADAYPNGELVDVFRQDWLTTLIKETKTNREFQPRTIDTARWAREQVKRQLGGASSIMAQA
ncbi:hypothetical protein BN1723_008142 [Verticillium longisporum]|uniref:Importin N-terminal domain-containing protein n=1 Tax=Verticillium longisporum TaxID=100787 RepID=A0A0G4NQG7_VERLO|nr:hypothetical protein BN1723_008142 [Verticillium longisporum]